MNSILDRFKFSPVMLAVDVGTGTSTGSWINCRDYPITCFWIHRGAVGSASDFFDIAKVQQATDASGTGAKDVGGLTLGPTLPLTTGSVAADSAILELDSEALDVTNNFKFATVLLSLSADGGSNLTTVIAIQGQARYAFRALNMRAIADAAQLVSKTMT